MTLGSWTISRKPIETSARNMLRDTGAVFAVTPAVEAVAEWTEF